MSRRLAGISNEFLENYSTLKPPITHGEAKFIIHVMQYIKMRN